MTSKSRKKVSQSIIILLRPYRGLLAELTNRKGPSSIIFNKTNNLSALTATHINIRAWKKSSGFLDFQKKCL